MTPGSATFQVASSTTHLPPTQVHCRHSLRVLHHQPKCIAGTACIALHNNNSLPHSQYLLGPPPSRWPPPQHIYHQPKCIAGTACIALHNNNNLPHSSSPHLNNNARSLVRFNLVRFILQLRKNSISISPKRRRLPQSIIMGLVKANRDTR